MSWRASTRPAPAASTRPSRSCARPSTGKREPQAEVARELARIYLATYRLTQAAEVVERYRELVPTDPEPYMWSNEIGSRSGATPRS